MPTRTALTLPVATLRLPERSGPTSVVNQKTTTPQPGDIYVGRPGPWGNPYSHLADTAAAHRVSSRSEAIWRHALWLSGQPDDILVPLHGRRLVCWCDPLPCHGRTLSFAADHGIDALRAVLVECAKPSGQLGFGF